MATQPLPLSHTQDTTLRAALCGLEQWLPPIRYTAREGGEADYYGASDLIAAQLQMERPLFTGFAASWAHGWTQQLPKFESPRLLVQDDYRHGTNLVDTEVPVKFLREHGYKSVAVGAPFLYADEATPPPRLPSSLLVFPPHSTAFSSLEATGAVLPYVEQVVKLKSRFKTVVASIGGPDVLKGNWIRAFEAAGIPWVCGAWVHDRNGLVRMQRIMRSFECTTTNVLGSHVAYAAYCGCKVVFHGNNLELKFEDVVSHPYYRANPELVEHLRDRMFNDAKLRERFPFLFLGFDEAPDLTAWGREQLGAAHRRPAREIATLLGWNLQPHGTGWRAANPLDAASNQELVDQAVSAQGEKRIEDVLLVTSVLKRRQLAVRNVELLRGLAFLHQKKPDQARAALGEELRLFPDNQKAQECLKQLNDTDRSPAKPHSQTSAMKPHPFLNPPLEINNVDLFVVRSTILKSVKAALPQFSGTFLDIGCGVMPYRGLITSAPSRVTKYLGLDLVSDIYRAEVDLRWDGKTIPLPDASVDSAMATEVLEHCPEPLIVLKEARRVLKPGGVFFFTVPYIWPLHDAPYDFFRYTPFALEKLLAEAGFTDVKIQAMSGWNAS
ncbi:MAG: class I SAM-dependent methyltransferase, partial [Verrucomicrobia bacterium]|nr:class I SAM-dependent methyltransferase [Verrucomicrobiota bacterium]